MTKQLIGLIPLLTACHLDLEMSVDVGFDDIQDQVDEIQDTEEPTESQPENPDPEEVTPDPEDVFCEVTMEDFHSGHAGESHFIEWEMEGNSDENTFIALVQGQELLLFEFLPPEANGFEFILPQESGEYTLFVASGDDPNNPLCATESTIEVLPFENPPEDPEESIHNTSSCFSFHDVTESFDVQIGESLIVEWDPHLFSDELLHIFMYDDVGLPTNIFLEETIENTGSVDLMLPEDLDEGVYGLSISSLDISQCIHGEVFVHQPI